MDITGLDIAIKAVHEYGKTSPDLVLAYGHPMHICVHNAVSAEVNCPILVPDRQENISQYPLPESEAEEKKQVFYDIYQSELFVLDVWPHWLINEHLIPNE